MRNLHIILCALHLQPLLVIVSFIFSPLILPLLPPCERFCNAVPCCLCQRGYIYLSLYILRCQVNHAFWKKEKRLVPLVTQYINQGVINEITEESSYFQ